MIFEISIVEDLTGKQSFNQNARMKGALPTLNCSSTTDFVPNMTKFHHGIGHVNSINCLILGFHGLCNSRKQHVNMVSLGIPSNSLLLVVTPYSW